MKVYNRKEQFEKLAKEQQEFITNSQELVNSLQVDNISFQEIGKEIIPVYEENFKRLVKGQAPLKLSKRAQKFIKHKVPFSLYRDVVSIIVKDPLYKTLVPFKVAAVDQKQEEDTWLKVRQHGAAFNDRTSDLYKQFVIGGSAIGNLLCRAEYPGQSKHFLKHKYQGKKFLGPINEIDPDIALAGHRAEDYLIQWSKQLLEEQCFKVKRVAAGNEITVEHPIFTFLQANNDGFVVLEDGSVNILEIKHTSSFNYKVVSDWQEGIVPKHYLAQITHYMSTFNVDKSFIQCGWGFRPNEMAIIEVDRNLNMEINMIARALYFFIEEVLKDGAVDDNNYSVLLDDLYSIYGDSREEVKEIKSDELYEDVKELKSIEDKLKDMRKENRNSLKPFEEQRDRLQAKLFEVAELADTVIIKNSKGDKEGASIKTKESTRVDTKKVRALKDKSLLKISKNRKVKV